VIFLLVAVKPPAVALTHGYAGIVGVAHPVDVMSRAPTVILDWNVERRPVPFSFFA
jgi:hypothetical protein